MEGLGSLKGIMEPLVRPLPPNFIGHDIKEFPQVRIPYWVVRSPKQWGPRSEIETSKSVSQDNPCFFKADSSRAGC